MILVETEIFSGIMLQNCQSSTGFRGDNKQLPREYAYSVAWTEYLMVYTLRGVILNQTDGADDTVVKGQRQFEMFQMRP